MEVTGIKAVKWKCRKEAERFKSVENKGTRKINEINCSMCEERRKRKRTELVGMKAVNREDREGDSSKEEGNKKE